MMIKERFGCGWDKRYAGKGIERPDSPLRTCPQYYARQPDVQEVIGMLQDYTRGALGPVGRLDAPMLDYLRCAEAARNEWADAQGISLGGGS